MIGSESVEHLSDTIIIIERLNNSILVQAFTSASNIHVTLTDGTSLGA